jgi:hypothetical protein
MDRQVSVLSSLTWCATSTQDQMRLAVHHLDAQRLVCRCYELKRMKMANGFRKRLEKVDTNLFQRWLRLTSNHVLFAMFMWTEKVATLPHVERQHTRKSLHQNIRCADRIVECSIKHNDLWNRSFGVVSDMLHQYSFVTKHECILFLPIFCCTMSGDAQDVFLFDLTGKSSPMNTQ